MFNKKSGKNGGAKISGASGGKIAKLFDVAQKTRNAASANIASQMSSSGFLNKDAQHLRYKICISGSAVTESAAPGTVEKAEMVGRLIAEQGMILVTGATTGIPYWAAKGAKEAGGFVIGLSPAATKIAHVKSYRLPLDYHDLIIYTGFEYSGRNLLLTRSADAVITISGRVGTLNEFTIAFEDAKPQGVLLGTGGTGEMLPEILEKAKRGFGKVVFESDPAILLSKVVALIKEEERELPSDGIYSSPRNNLPVRAGASRRARG